MKKLHAIANLTIALATAYSVVGCGTQGAVDAANSIPGKLDTTNGQMTTMTGKLDATNKNMNGMSTKLDETNASTKSLGSKMDITNAAIHDQALGVALDTMLKPENTKYLTSPTNMFPAGQVFADVAGPDEVLQLIHVTMLGIQTQAPDPSLLGTDGTFPPAVIASTDHDKLSKFIAIEIISGLMSQEKVDQIVKAQIEAGGLYQTEAYQLMALRFDFIDNLELTNDLLTQPLSNPGKMQQAVTLTNALEAITKLKDVAKFEAKTTGMLNADDNRDLTVTPGMVTALWKKIAKAFDKDLDPQYLQPTNPGAKTLATLKTEVLTHIPAAVPAPN